jgi:hypothetical protein
MRNDTRWRVIPATRLSCVLSLVAGVLLLGSSILTSSRTPFSAPALQIVVAVLAAVMVICAVIGLASPRLRGR